MKKPIVHYWFSWCMPKPVMLCRLAGASATTHIRSRLKEVTCENCLKRYTYKALPK